MYRFDYCDGFATRSEKWWGCAAGRWKLDPKRSREKWNLGPKRSNSVRIGSFNTPKDRFGVGGWEKIPQKERARSCQSEKRGSKPRHICITHHIGSTPPPPPPPPREFPTRDIFQDCLTGTGTISTNKATLKDMGVYNTWISLGTDDIPPEISVHILRVYCKWMITNTKQTINRIFSVI